MSTHKAKAGASKAVDHVVQGIIDDILIHKKYAIIMIAIPSRDKKNNELPDTKQGEWHRSAMKLFADLFVGATSMRTHKGIYKSDEGDYLWDDSILVQSWVKPSTVEKTEVVQTVVDFARKMRRELNQEAVLVIFDEVVRFIKAER